MGEGIVSVVYRARSFKRRERKCFWETGEIACKYDLHMLMDSSHCIEMEWHAPPVLFRSDLGEQWSSFYDAEDNAEYWKLCTWGWVRKPVGSRRLTWILDGYGGGDSICRLQRKILSKEKRKRYWAKQERWFKNKIFFPLHIWVGSSCCIKTEWHKHPALLQFQLRNK